MSDLERIKKNIERYSFPRLSGTRYEKKAFEDLKKNISNLNVQVQTQKFLFSPFYSRVYPKTAFSLVSYLLLMLFLGIENIIITLSIIMAILLLIFLVLLTRKPEKISFGPIMTSKNLIAKIRSINSEDSEQDIKDIMFMCHIDSKSQNLPIRIRSMSNMIWFISLIGSIIIIGLRGGSGNSLILFIAGLIIIMINITATSLIIINFTGNKSPGAIDNGSGIACVLELLDHFSKKNLKNINLWFIFTGAEECGTMGVRHFCQMIKDMDKNAIIIHNFESLASNVYAFVSKALLKNEHPYFIIFKEKSKDLNYKTVNGSYTVAFHTDGIYLMHKGYQVLEFESSDTGWYMHTTEDTPDKIDNVVLKNLCDVLIESIVEFDYSV